MQISYQYQSITQEIFLCITITTKKCFRFKLGINVANNVKNNFYCSPIYFKNIKSVRCLSDGLQYMFILYVSLLFLFMFTKYLMSFNLCSLYMKNSVLLSVRSPCRVLYNFLDLCLSFTVSN